MKTTIHQPNEIILNEFSRLLLMEKGGNVVYDGDLPDI